MKEERDIIMALDLDKPKQFMDDFEEFLNHNLGLGYITKDTTVEELLGFINNVKYNFLPMLNEIEKTINK